MWLLFEFYLSTDIDNINERAAEMFREVEIEVALQKELQRLNQEE